MYKLPVGLFFIALMVLSTANGAPDDAERQRQARDRMVRSQIEARGISDPAVLSAMRKVPRHLFVPHSLWPKAYEDYPLPIGEGQTISQPYIVALMTQSLQLGPRSRVLEIGTGSGYQAAILSQVAAAVYTVEIKEGLYRKSSRRLKELGFNNVAAKLGDGYYGWPAHAPFDGIMITAAVDHIPPPLINQLKDGGRLILPLGNPFSYQNLVKVTRQGGDLITENITAVRFVPLTGEALNK